MAKGPTIQERMKSIRRIGLIGSGNVATALGRAWLEHGIEIVACYNRKQSPLSWNSDLQPLASPRHFPNTLDAILVATSDDSVFEIIANLPTGPLVVHFSGSLPLPARPGGAIWPIQSIRKETNSAGSTFPLVLNATDDEAQQLLMPFAQKIASQLHSLSDIERKAAHLAAVFASNFSNHSLSIAQALAAKSRLPWSTFEPLIQTILEQGTVGASFNQQTGPALRREEHVLQAHREALNSNPEWLSVYEAMTASIQGMHAQPAKNDSNSDPSHEHDS